MRKLIIVAGLILSSSTSYADQSRNQGAVNNLCQNLTAACKGGDEASCKAAKDTGCKCDDSTGTCTRGNYSDQNN